ncbi:hypothetical protein AB1Y20_002723 [Prymnesium parvum]|uniref:Solute carrier family 40 protein n=1 Tax=Prymnesium parvum TaxID=97485 RepID=A0AB34J9D6_PRYPA
MALLALPLLLGLLTTPPTAALTRPMGDMAHRRIACARRPAFPLARASLCAAAGGAERPVIPPWLLLAMVFTHVLSNALLSQAVPTAMLGAMKNDRVATAHALGRLSACGAMIDILVAPQLGRLSDAIGRKPLLIALPCIALLLRSVAASFPSIAVIAPIKAMSATLSSGFLLSLRASLADQYRKDTETLTGRLGLISAANGAAHAGGLFLGGQLVARSLRLPYAASSALLGILVSLLLLRLRESLPRAQRIAFRWRTPAFSFVRLFRSGPSLRRLASISTLQTISISMGDTWQVFARELRGWGAVECGQYGSLTGLGSMLSALLVKRSVQRVGARRHTLLATGCVGVTEMGLGCIPSQRGVFLTLLPNWIGRTQTVALSARITTVGAAVGYTQGCLAGDRQNLQALLKALCPILYSYLFALGCRIGRPELPFVTAASFSAMAVLLVFLSSRTVWSDAVEEE